MELPYHSPELGRLQWVTKELLYPFQFVVKAQARVRDLITANEFIDEIKQHEDFILTHRALDLTSLGGVDRFGYPTDQDSETVKVYSQAGIGIFIGEKSLVPEARSTCLYVIPAQSLECFCRAWLQKLVVWVRKWTQCSSMEIC